MTTDGERYGDAAAAPQDVPPKAQDEAGEVPPAQVQPTSTPAADVVDKREDEEIEWLLRLVPDELRPLLPRKDRPVDLGPFARALKEWASKTNDGTMLVTAGILIAWAAEVLKHESADVLAKWMTATPVEPAVDDPLAQAAEILEDAYGERAYTEAVLSGKVQPLERVGRKHVVGRRVSLIELLQALSEARVAAVQRLSDQEQRAEARAAARAKRKERAQGSMHEDDLHKDLQEFLDKLPKDGALVALRELATTREAHVSAIRAVCHLGHYMHAGGRVVIAQDDFPFGPVYVRRAIASGRDAGDDDQEGA